MGLAEFFREQIRATKAEFRSYPRRRLFFLGLVAFFCFLILINIWNYVSEQTAAWIDVYFQGIALSWRTPFLNSFFSTITFLGSNMFIIGSFFVISVVLVQTHRKKALTAILIALLGSETLVQVLKQLSERVRPSGCINGWDCFSFPSGHATMAFYFYGLLAFLVFRFTKLSRRLKVLLASTLGFLAILVSASRIYLNYHFFTDIVGGFLLGVFWLIIVTAMIDFFYQE